MLAGPIYTACAPGEVTFRQLFAEPDRFSGKTISLEGFYFNGFEASIFCEELKLSGYAEGHLVPASEGPWVNGGVPRDIYDNLYIQKMMGPEERYGKLRITGVFEYGDRYGHMGAYSSQITVSEAELLPWTPQQPDDNG